MKYYAQKDGGEVSSSKREKAPTGYTDVTKLVNEVEPLDNLDMKYDWKKIVLYEGEGYKAYNESILQGIEEDAINKAQDVFTKVTAYSIVNSTGWSYPTVTKAIGSNLDKEGDLYDNVIEELTK